MKTTFFRSSVILIGIFLFTSCQPDEPDQLPTQEQTIEKELDAFVAKLVSNPPDTADISGRVNAYLASHPLYFFGSTVTLLDNSFKSIYSPYWYRLNDTLAYKNLADTAYHIDEQSWLREPIDEAKSVWTAPYFDAGGGEIWMKTRSVPVIVNGKIIAVATTDLALE